MSRRIVAAIAGGVAGIALLAAPAARGEIPDAGVAVAAPDAGGLPGRSVELVEGQPAPFDGNLCDVECARSIYEQRRAATELARLEGLRLQDAEVARARAEGERDAAKSRPSWGVVIGVGGAGLVVGIVTGLVLGLRAAGK